MAGRGRPRKDKFADLDDEFKDAIAQSSPEDIKKRVAKIALDNEELLRAKEDDEDLAEKLEIAKDAGAVYREGVKANRLRIQFCKRVLEDKGVNLSLVPSSDSDASFKNEVETMFNKVGLKVEKDVLVKVSK